MERSDQIQVIIDWQDSKPLQPGRFYRFTTGVQSAIATVTRLKHRVDPDTGNLLADSQLTRNQKGVCNLSLSSEILFRDGELERFDIHDLDDDRVLGHGEIQFSLHRAHNIQWQPLTVDKQARARLKNQKPCIVWFTGLSGSGKSTLANALETRLHALGQHTYLMDGDNIRHGINKDLGFTEADRIENIRRVSEVARLMLDAGLIVLTSFISPFRAERTMARNLVENGEFIEVFVDTPMAECETRDPKGLYARARQGKIRNFTGIDSPYEAPEQPEVRIDTTRVGIDDAVSLVIETMQQNGNGSGA